MDAVRYHYLCAAHGQLGSAPVHPRTSPPERRCPICAAPTEVWVGKRASADFEFLTEVRPLVGRAG
ncbi:MAG TPA: hypothetical protein VEP49_18290 [Acidimicrobiia bacterium]|nr:hypothetical protein [Acidimicrobiia bacterium]